MKQQPRQSMPRPFAYTRRTPRTRPETAAELVRLEYERDRLERDLRAIEERRARTLDALRKVSARARRLTEMLDPSGGR